MQKTRNLLSNAIKFSYRNSKILINDEYDDKYLKISIEDFGTGIPLDKVDSIFDQGNSFSTKGTEKEKGTGLGLVLCKDFVEKSGGKIFVENKSDKGAVFSFTLPILKN